MVEEGNLKGERTSDQDMIGRMKEKGAPPKEINDALNRQKIKNAVSADIESDKESMEPSIMMPERPITLPTEGRDLKEEDLTPPPIMAREKDRSPKAIEIGEESYVPKPQEETYAPSQEYAPPQGYSVPQEYAPQEYYDEYVPGVGGITDADTMIEISEQVFSEKIKQIQKQVEEMNEFKGLAETKIEYISSGLKRIEKVIDRLQAAILEKVGAYGRGVEGIKKEMSMMQESFGKMVGGLAKQHPATSHIPKKKTILRKARQIPKKNTIVHKTPKKISKRK